MKKIGKVMAIGIAIMAIAISGISTVSAALAGYSGYCYDVDARSNSILQSYHGGWVEDGAGARFICDDNTFVTGWWKIGQDIGTATWRFFDENGYLVKGWAGFDANDKRVWNDWEVTRSRFFDPYDGHLLEGYQTITWNGASYNYYFAPSTSTSNNFRNGILLKNAQAPNGAWADANGVLQWSQWSQWSSTTQTIPSQVPYPQTYYSVDQYNTTNTMGSYYLGGTGAGTATSPTWAPCQTVDQYQYYPGGTYPGGQQTAGTAGNGTGWVKTGSYYKHYTNGKLDKGLTAIGGYYYYFDGSGNMATGWRTVGSSHRYFDKTTGIMYYGGWATIDGYAYYFDTSGVNLRDSITPDGYYVGTNGRWDGKTRLSTSAPGYGY